jgi:hypothetical protein
MQEFDVEKEQCEREVITYLEKLVSEGLILVSDKPEN